MSEDGTDSGTNFKLHAPVKSLEFDEKEVIMAVTLLNPTFTSMEVHHYNVTSMEKKFLYEFLSDGDFEYLAIYDHEIINDISYVVGAGREISSIPFDNWNFIISISSSSRKIV